MQTTNFLFLTCDGQAKVLDARRQELNRHVQHTYRQSRLHQRMPVPPLPRQIKFRTSTQCQNPLSRSSRDYESSIPKRTPSPLDLTLPLYKWESPSECMLYDPNQIFCDKASHFWEIYVLQSCHQLPVIKQSLIALSLAFRETDFTDTFSRNRRSQSNASTAAASSKAINMLRAYMQYDKNPSHAVVLTCAIILYAHAKVLGDDKAASLHLERAINIFDAWAVSLNRLDMHAGFEHIRSVLLLLDVSSTIEDKARVPTMTQPRPQLARFDSVEGIVHGYCVVCQAMLIFTIVNYKHIVAGYASCPVRVLQEKTKIANDL